MRRRRNTEDGGGDVSNDIHVHDLSDRHDEQPPDNTEENPIGKESTEHRFIVLREDTCYL